MTSSAFSMGESVHKAENIAKGGKIFSPGDFSSSEVIIDGDFQETATLLEKNKDRELILELKKTGYIEKIKVFFKNKNPDYQVSVNKAGSLGLSTDFLNWKKVTTGKKESIKKSEEIIEDIFYCDDLAAKYIKLQFPKKEEIEILEVEVYPTEDYVLELNNIEVKEGSDKTVISFESNFDTSAQIAYGYNYDYVYENALRKTIMDLSFRKKHVMTIPKLIPRTSYRFQIILTDYNNKIKKSGFILFTTKKKV